MQCLMSKIVVKRAWDGLVYNNFFEGYQQFGAKTGLQKVENSASVFLLSIAKQEYTRGGGK